MNPKLKTWTFEDRSTWPDFDRGWGEEPDKAEWRDEATGLPCIARRGSSGAWCGYVGVGPDHPLYGVERDDCPQRCPEFVEKSYCCHTAEHILNVHGGITYSAPCQPEDKELGICHVPQPGEADQVFWLGFDCAHAGDFTPAFWKYIHQLWEKFRLETGYDLLTGDTYKTLAYVQSECAGLAHQLVALDG